LETAARLPTVLSGVRESGRAAGSAERNAKGDKHVPVLRLFTLQEVRQAD
jgi:hypothetical protein